MGYVLLHVSIKLHNMQAVFIRSIIIIITPCLNLRTLILDHHKQLLQLQGL